jgi:hypothetical protein
MYSLTVLTSHVSLNMTFLKDLKKPNVIYPLENSSEGKRDLYKARTEEKARARPPTTMPTFEETVTNFEN